MQSSRPIETDIVLLGAGHAHVEVLRRFAMRPEPGVRLTLIAREPETPYSGMLPGLIRSEYTHQQAHIDLAPLAALANARLILGEAIAFDPDGRAIAVVGRPDIPFDLLSINIGGVPATPPGAGIPVKPIGGFLDRLHRLEAELPAGSRIAVVGGGTAGVELALALAMRFAGQLRLVLVSATPDPVAAAPAVARRAVRQALVEAGIELVCGVRATSLTGDRLLLSDGSYVEVATALWATGVEGPPLLAAAGVACDRSGCIRITSELRSVSHQHIFAAGDCAALEGEPRPKAGSGRCGPVDRWPRICAERRRDGHCGGGSRSGTRWLFWGWGEDAPSPGATASRCKGTRSGGSRIVSIAGGCACTAKCAWSPTRTPLCGAAASSRSCPRSRRPRS